MPNIKLLLEYDGSNFVGWQTQPNGRSVQEEMTKVLTQVLQEPINLIGAGRTDAGVHARGQVANFRTEATLRPDELFEALNGLLPPDVTVRKAEEVEASFHSRYDADYRVYRYFISRERHAVGRFYQWHLRYALDLGVMNSVAGQLVGEHDFEAFCKAAATTRHYLCTIMTSCWKEHDATIVYEVKANRFLHGMVRALVGTMIDVGRGYTPAEEFAGILESRDRSRSGMAAPPHGLFLEEVHYPAGAQEHGR
ncbi:MAG: tRNA pseudouridine(38-40) synthase TruA [Ignavibacteria bacterium]|nr:tRNA pseudouridine(38-40) synthase TruA [Ignavibacteria bacterium]